MPKKLIYLALAFVVVLAAPTCHIEAGTQGESSDNLPQSFLALVSDLIAEATAGLDAILLGLGPEMEPNGQPKEHDAVEHARPETPAPSLGPEMEPNG